MLFSRMTGSVFLRWCQQCSRLAPPPQRSARLRTRTAAAKDAASPTAANDAYGPPPSLSPSAPMASLPSAVAMIPLESTPLPRPRAMRQRGQDHVDGQPAMQQDESSNSDSRGEAEALAGPPGSFPHEAPQWAVPPVERWGEDKLLMSG